MRRWFDRRWPRLETWGLRITGAYLAIIGALEIYIARVDPVRSVGASGLLLTVFGIVLWIAGVLAFDRSREDLVTWIAGGTAGLYAAFFLFGSTPGVDLDAVFSDLVILGVALFGLRAFRGAFRKRREVSAAAVTGAVPTSAPADSGR